MQDQASQSDYIPRGRSRKKARKRLLLGSLALLLLALAAAATGAARFVLAAIVPQLEPMATITPDEPITIALDETDIRYAFGLVVEDPEEGARRVAGPMPDLTVTSAAGKDIPLSGVDSWQSIGANDYLFRSAFRLTEPGEVTISAAIPEDKTGAAPVHLLPYTNDLTDRAAENNGPIWIASGLTVAAAFGLFALAMLLYVMEPDHHQDDELG